MTAWRGALRQRAFHLLYHELAWAYDAVSYGVSLGRWQAWGEAALAFLPGPRVLELGHGPGYLLATLTEGAWWPVGVDLSGQMGRLAQQRLGRRGLPVRLVRGRGQALPFAAGTFDGVVAAFPAPYLLQQDTIRAIWRVLRHGGRLVIVPEAELTGADPLARMMEGLLALAGQQYTADSSEQGRGGLWNELFAGTGFAVTVHHVAQLRSRVTVVVAERIG
ncbi:MAG: class I SAM-dependent methyltransferase [Candidatus Promineofilum sp.]|nr:class I SAM-dependent methyltransferase [Promineifilum sp.]